MTPQNKKLKKLWLYAYQMKDSYPGSKKIEKNTILDHLMTPNDHKNENCKTLISCISNES
jgi:hypothetical protein